MEEIVDVARRAVRDVRDVVCAQSVGPKESGEVGQSTTPDTLRGAARLEVVVMKDVVHRQVNPGSLEQKMIALRRAVLSRLRIRARMNLPVRRLRR